MTTLSTLAPYQQRIIRTLDEDRLIRWLGFLWKQLEGLEQPFTSDQQIWYEVRRLSIPSKILAHLAPFEDLKPYASRLLKEIGEEVRDLIVNGLGERWTDPAHDNGNAIYRTVLEPQLLLRGVLFRRHLLRDQQWSSKRFKLAMGYAPEGGPGGQITADRFQASEGKMFDLIQHLGDLHKAGTLPLSPVEICLSELKRLEDEERDRYWMAYRWFESRDGELPPLHLGTITDSRKIPVVERVLKKATTWIDSRPRYPSGKIVDRASAIAILQGLSERVEIPDFEEAGEILAAIAKALEEGTI